VDQIDLRWDEDSVLTSDLYIIHASEKRSSEMISVNPMGNWSHASGGLWNILVPMCQWQFEKGRLKYDTA